MGTMSRCQRNRNRPLWREKSSTHAKRLLEGTLLHDVLAVFQHERKFNRTARRVAKSLLQRHAKRLKINVAHAWHLLSGIEPEIDSIAGVQGRILAYAGKL